MKSNQILFHVIFPMLIGGFIYIIFREKKLLMFNWFSSLELINFIDDLRNVTLNLQLIIPDWIKFSLADGIWVYSLTSLMLIIWYQKTNKLRFIWLILGPMLGIIMEVGQLVNIVPGTYDNIDLLFIFLGSITPFIIVNKKVKIK